MPDKLPDSELEQAIDKAANLEPIEFCGLMCKFTEDIINRLQAENERLKTEKDNLIRTYSECQIANLQEFMHRAENKLANNTDISMAGYQSIICDMEEAYKELVGEDNG